MQRTNASDSSWTLSICGPITYCSTSHGSGLASAFRSRCDICHHWLPSFGIGPVKWSCDLDSCMAGEPVVENPESCSHGVSLVTASPISRPQDRGLPLASRVFVEAFTSCLTAICNGTGNKHFESFFPFVVKAAQTITNTGEIVQSAFLYRSWSHLP